MGQDNMRGREMRVMHNRSGNINPMLWIKERDRKNRELFEITARDFLMINRYIK